MWNEETREKLRTEILPALEKEAWGLSDDMAEHPELGSREFESSRKIVEMMRAHGIEVEYPYCGVETAFRAVINPGGKKKAAFLAEYDALPEIGHACGHCASGMASVLAGLAVQEVRDTLGDVQIDIIGTPDEEWGAARCCCSAQVPSMIMISRLWYICMRWMEWKPDFLPSMAYSSFSMAHRLMQQHVRKKEETPSTQHDFSLTVPI